MRENLQCNCHICKIERHLVISLSDPHHSDEFLRLAHAAAPLATFSTACALVEHLHAHRDGEKSVPSASEVVASLMQSSSLISETELRNSVLVLSFVPMIHRTYREVRAWFREIEAEDIAQQILTLFLELVDSAGTITLSNHLPIALTRTLRKNAFRWAEKAKRLTVQREFDKSQPGDEPGANDAVTISRFSASGHDRLRLPVPFVPITDFVDTSRPHNANDHIRLGEMKRLWKAVLGGGRRSTPASSFCE